jgi:hypothetical protein
MMSPKLVGFTAASVRRMPSDSSWNTPTVSPRLEQAVDVGIVPGQRIEIDLDVAPAEQVDRLAQHRQRLEAEEVELHQPASSTYFMSNCVTGMSERGSR